MPDNTYTAKTRLLAPVPRSKRMRDANVTVAQQSSSSQQVEQTWNRDTESVQDAEVLVPVAQPLIDILRLRNGNHIVNITVDNNGNLHVDAGLYSDSFISALGLNPDAPTPGGGGLDEDELWTILGGSSTNHHILPTYLDSVPWASLTGKPSWIGSSKPFYDWSEILNKPSWIGSSKPSYAFNEITGSITSNQMSAGINNLSTGSSEPTDADYYVTQYAGGGTSTTSYHRRPHSALYSYIKNKATGTWGINISGSSSSCTGNSATASAIKSINIPSVNSNAIIYYSGQPTIGSSDGNCFGGSSNNYNLWSYPTNAGTSVSSTAANVMNFRFVWNSSYYHELYCTPNNEGLWYRAVINGSAKTWKKILNDTNYSSYALPLTGGTLTGTLNVNQSAWDNGIVLNRTSSNAGTGIKCLSNNTVLGTFGINGDKQFEIDIHNGTSNVQYVNVSTSMFNIGRSDVSNYAINISSSTSRLRLLANSNGDTYIQSGNPAFTASADLHITGYNSNNVTNLYLHANNIVCGSSTDPYEKVFRFYNTARNCVVDLTTAGRFGFYDSTNARWILCSSKSAATTYIPSEKLAIGYSVDTSTSEKLQVNGNIYATGAITAGASSSDKRLKKDIKQFNAMSIVDALRPIQFRWNNVAKGLDKYFDTDEIQYGLIAQECDKAMPGLAFKFKANDYYGVRYEKLIPVLLEAIKELKQDINQLKEARV